ncbi:HTTM domain-containing protein [Actinoplanes sp. NPDC023801]|uniref:HTTM domain-containing protein n=1 Tax=Actinoplanes sp. NPDC023801 TaxID=3154595 RepID=UPI00340889CD
MAVDQTSPAYPAPEKADVAPEGITPAGRLRNRFDDVYRLLTRQPLSLYATAVMRIGFGLLYTIMLVREFPYRHQIWGPESPWSPDLARRMFDEYGLFSVLNLSDDPRYFEACYAFALITAVVFMLGWRTRVVSLVFALVMFSFYSRGVFMTDGGDNLAVLMSVYLCFTACGRVWSLDARRHRRHDDGSRPEKPGGIRILRRFTVTVMHNCALVVMMAQMCVLYGAAGLYKVQGNLWNDGTALHYVLKTDSFRPWPALSDFVDGHQVLIGISCYLTVLVQVAFPFSLFSKLKYVLLPILVGMHVGIAVLMALPLFSAVMILSDAVFLPDRFYRAVARKGSALIAAVSPRRAATRPH